MTSPVHVLTSTREVVYDEIQITGNSIGGFGGLEVSVLAFDTRVRGFTPGRSRRIFSGEKILTPPSFGGKVKPSVPCRKFT